MEKTQKEKHTLKLYLIYDRPRTRYYSKKFIDKSDYEVVAKRLKASEFAEAEVIDTERDRERWVEPEDSDDGLEHYMATGKLKLKY